MQPSLFFRAPHIFIKCRISQAFDDFGSFVDEEVKRTLAQKNLFISAGSSEEQSLNSPGQSSINFEKGTPTRAYV